MITQITTNKIIVKADAPKIFKSKVTQLLNKLMEQYQITSDVDNGMVDAFKDIFKSNLYYLIDNYYDVKK